MDYFKELEAILLEKTPKKSLNYLKIFTKTLKCQKYPLIMIVIFAN